MCVRTNVHVCKMFWVIHLEVPGHTAPLVKNCRWNGLLLQCIYHSTPQGTYLDIGSTVSAIHTLAHQTRHAGVASREEVKAGPND